MASSDRMQSFSGNQIPGRLRTSKDAADLLERLRVAYQSLAPDQRQEIKDRMALMFDSQRRSGGPAIPREPVGIESEIN